MQMYRDTEGRRLMMQSGLMEMAESGATDPAVVKRVVDLITTGSALPLKQQLTANGIGFSNRSVG
jgi:blue copper oxidase